MDSDKIVRDAMSSYWQEHAKECSVREMMLDDNAEEFSDKERKEILGILPPLSGLNVLELGAGIGRFTGDLAKAANRVIAVDFMENFLTTNKQTHQHMGNISYTQADVTTLELPGQSQDLIFSNWLLMYLSDEEVEALVNKMLSWLTDGGFLIFRESCYHRSGIKSRTTNPTNYRSPQEYNSFMLTPRKKEHGHRFGFEVLKQFPIQTYVEVKANKNQVCWLLRKVKLDTNEKICHEKNFVEEYLERGSFRNKMVHEFEKIHGSGFTAVGGERLLEIILKGLTLKQNMTVLDFGCEPGGNANYFYQVDFKIGDHTAEIEDNKADVIFSRNGDYGVQDKFELIKRFKEILKSDGQICIADTCLGKSESAKSFQNHLSNNGIFPLNIESSKLDLEKAGFQNVKVDIQTDEYISILSEDIKSLKIIMESENEAENENLRKILRWYTSKLQNLQNDTLRWVTITANI